MKEKRQNLIHLATRLTSLAVVCWRHRRRRWCERSRTRRPGAIPAFIVSAGQVVGCCCAAVVAAAVVAAAAAVVDDVFVEGPGSLVLEPGEEVERS